jgi:hypothetical protein
MWMWTKEAVWVWLGIVVGIGALLFFVFSN